MARGRKSRELFLWISIVSLIICAISIIIGELYFRGTEFVDIYCAIGAGFFFLFLLNFGIAEILIRANNIKYAKKEEKMEDLVNRIAERIDRLVKNLPVGECGICKDAYKNYDGKCRDYTWDMSYFSENAAWDFSLREHGREIWHKTVEGDIGDALLSALEALHKSEWKR